MPPCLRPTKLFPAARNSPGCDKRLRHGNNVIWRETNIADCAIIMATQFGLICPLLSRVKQCECVLRFMRISRFIFAISTESIIIISEKSVRMLIGSRNMRFAVTTKACYPILNNIALTLELSACSLRYFDRSVSETSYFSFFANCVNIIES